MAAATIAAAWAAGMDTVRVTVGGGDLATAITITDKHALQPFRVGAGPGNFRREGNARMPSYPPQCFIVDWARGPVAVPGSAAVYDVAFVTTRADRDTYVVKYAVDRTGNEAYVYFPGKGEAGYADNVWIILRGVEGQWFHSWSKWDDVVRPLLRDAPKAHVR